MKYYLCEYENHRALKEFETSQEVANYIKKSEFPHLFCSMSRYMLAKEGSYPKTKEGNMALQSDISKKYFVVESTFPRLEYE